MTDDARVHHLDHRVAQLFRGDRSGVLARLDGHEELQVAGRTSAGEAACGCGGRMMQTPTPPKIDRLRPSYGVFGIRKSSLVNRSNSGTDRIFLTGKGGQ